MDNFDLSQRQSMVSRNTRLALCASLVCVTLTYAETPRDLRLGIANHAFDHLGNIGEQADAAAQSGATVIYATGLGALGYQGLPAAKALSEERRKTSAYIRHAKSEGIRLVLGYVCATSIVKLDAFDQNWTPKFRATFRTPVAEWRQQSIHGEPLKSWYGGDYQPACMNNPDWLAYEKFIVRQQIESGCDGVFFDNPTVHPQGCYCPHCMKKFEAFLQHVKSFPFPEPTDNPSHRDKKAKPEARRSLTALRELAQKNSKAFQEFRCTIAKDFLADIREYARTIKRSALITANNSLNSHEVLYSQCRSYAYNIYEMSKAEDFVVVEDMSSQPRTLANGQTIEYGPTYKQLHAISHGKPVVAVTIADADYHTPPNLVRLAMAEAAANGASYLSWPTWPQKERARMISAIRPQSDLLRRNQALLNETQPRNDVVLFLPFRRWIETSHCVASDLAAELSRANVQFNVICEDHLQTAMQARVDSRGTGTTKTNFPELFHGAKIFLAESPAVLTQMEKQVLENFESKGGYVVFAEQKSWLHDLQHILPKPSLALEAPPTVRAVVRDQPKRTIVHLLNLDVQRLGSFEDRVRPAKNVRLSLRVPFEKIHSVRALTADSPGTSGALEFTTERDGDETIVKIIIPRLEISTILVCEK